jgi:SPP1 gp7 family putative phage head morphogenesis protein
VESQYARQLTQLARNVGGLIRTLDIGLLPEVLSAYVDALIPWARGVALTMLKEVDAKDRDAWRALGTSISQQLHADLRTAPVGNRVQELLTQQVELITSIPRQAAERAHALVKEGLEGGKRASEVAEELERTTEVTRSRAILIARTETSRAATVLVQARAESVGSTAYLWRTAMDSDVRPGHEAMEGKVCEWANPPAVDEGGRILHHHPGAVWNCRCYAEPVLSDPYQPRTRGRKR